MAVPEVICRNPRDLSFWVFVVLGLTGVPVTAYAVRRGLDGSGTQTDLTLGITGVLVAVGAVVAVYYSAAETRADATGVRTKTLLRRRSTAWRDVADVQVYLRNQYVEGPTFCRIRIALRGGGGYLLPLPHAVRGATDDKAVEFDAALRGLRALHRAYGSPDSDRLVVVTARSAGHSRLASALVCVLLLAGAGLVAWLSYEHFVLGPEPAVIVVLLALSAGYPAARVVMWLRGRRVPADTVLPSVLPFVGALLGTALWLVPLAYFYASARMTTPVAIAFAGAGVLISLGFLVLAWDATRIRDLEAPRRSSGAPSTRSGEGIS